MLRDTAVSLLQCTEPVPATRQPSTSLSIIPSKDAEGSPSQWRVPLLPGLLDTPSQVCLPLHDTLIPLSHFLHEWERLPWVSLWVLRTIRTGYTLQFGKNPPRFDGVHLTVVNSAAKASVLQQELSSSPAERSNRRSTAVGSRTRFLQPLLPRSKEGRRLEAYSGSTAFEFFPLQREVQDADDENHHVSGPGGRLVCHHRPEGCVFSHPGRSKTQEIPSVRLWREGLPIQGPALRPGFGSEDIYQMHGCCTGPFEAPGHSCTELSGRLAHSGSLQGASESSQGYRSRPHPFSWPLQERLTAGAAATTLRVYVAAIAARRELDEIPLGRHRMVSAFMRGARRLRPVRPTAVPSWDLSVVLEGLVTAPFEPLESASDRILTLKVVLLLALTSLKRVGDLQAFSVSETCMDFAPGLVKVTLRPRPGYIPEVLSTLFRSQVVTLHSFHPPPFASSEDERLHMLCPVRALKLYVDRSRVWRKSPQLLICFGAGRRGLATSKQRISHWVRDAISLAYEARKLPSPLSLRAHSTRGVASSQALFRGVPLEEYLCCGRMVLSAHLSVLQPWRWYGSRFSGPVCLNRPYVVGSLLGQIGSVFSLACLVYRSRCVS